MSADSASRARMAAHPGMRRRRPGVPRSCGRFVGDRGGWRGAIDGGESSHGKERLVGQGPGPFPRQLHRCEAEDHRPNEDRTRCWVMGSGAWQRGLEDACRRRPQAGSRESRSTSEKGNGAQACSDGLPAARTATGCATAACRPARARRGWRHRPRKQASATTTSRYHVRSRYLRLSRVPCILFRYVRVETRWFRQSGIGMERLATSPRYFYPRLQEPRRSRSAKGSTSCKHVSCAGKSCAMPQFSSIRFAPPSPGM